MKPTLTTATNDTTSPRPSIAVSSNITTTPTCTTMTSSMLTPASDEMKSSLNMTSSSTHDTTKHDKTMNVSSPPIQPPSNTPSSSTHGSTVSPATMMSSSVTTNSSQVTPLTDPLSFKPPSTHDTMTLSHAVASSSTKMKASSLATPPSNTPPKHSTMDAQSTTMNSLSQMTQLPSSNIPPTHDTMTSPHAMSSASVHGSSVHGSMMSPHAMSSASLHGSSAYGSMTSPAAMASASTPMSASSQTTPSLSNTPPTHSTTTSQSATMNSSSQPTPPSSTLPPPSSRGSEVMTWPINTHRLFPSTNQLALPAKFPDINTDLKCPPTNWLRSHTKVEEYAKNFNWNKENSRKSSFAMAHKVPELVGEDVDVISDSENIKQLLKMPFEKSHLSMMVHRVGKTLLIDDFDIHKHLLREQQEEWKWLMDFYKETVLENMQQKMKCVPRKNRSRNHLQMRNLFSKFLYYSIADSDDASMPELDASLRECGIHDDTAATIPDPLPEMPREEFAREVLWEFRDIRMLIGTDLPIFRAGNHPAVSVRLREMRQPINVLTGLDCWLDNLMCNVPNLAMCYHINGLIQDYKLIKTEDIPNEEGGQFSPHVVTDIARNILSFLKSNATKEGHTYWLYKEVDDDVVKLYDLTTLCADQMADRSDNQFTVPLDMLLYRVARNMRERGNEENVIDGMFSVRVLYHEDK